MKSLQNLQQVWLSNNLDLQYICKCLFVLGLNVSVTLFQSYWDGIHIGQVIELPHWSAPLTGTWQEHPSESHYKLTLGRSAMFPSNHLLMHAKHKQGSYWYHLFTTFGMWLLERSNPYPSVPQADALPLNHQGGYNYMYSQTYPKQLHNRSQIPNKCICKF